MSQLTISAWLYWDPATGSNAESIFGGWYWDSNVQNEQGYDLRFAAGSSSVEFNLITQNSNGVKSDNVAVASVAVSTGQWYYVAATYDAASGTQTIYVNGARRELPRSRPAIRWCR